MSVENLTLILHLILAALYLALLITLVQRHAGHENAAMLLSGYILIGAFLVIAEGMWRSGRFHFASPQLANDLQMYGALALAFLLTLTIGFFTRRSVRLWLAVGAVWML